MKDVCPQYRAQLVDAAEGKSNPELEQHLLICSKCSQLLENYRAMLKAADGLWESAPANLVLRAKNLMPETRRVVIARRLGLGTLGAARGPLDEFQVMVGDDSTSVRLMASPTANGWSIMGRVPSEAWEVDSPVPVELAEGRFQFTVAALEDSSFELVGPDVVLHIPPLSELIQNDRD